MTEIIDKILNVFDRIDNLCEKKEENDEFVKFFKKIVSNGKESVSRNANKSKKPELEALQEKLDAASKFIQSYESKFFVDVQNFVYANKNYDELNKITKDFQIALQAFDHHRLDNMEAQNNELLLILRNLVNSIGVNASEKSSSAELLRDLVRFNNPLGYNPCRDVLLHATLDGSIINGDQFQKEKFLAFLKESNDVGICEMFKNKERTDNELQQYFSEYKFFFKTKKTNLKTVVYKAIEQENSENLFKYLRGKKSDFEGKVFGARPAVSVEGEIIEATPIVFKNILGGITHKFDFMLRESDMAFTKVIIEQENDEEARLTFNKFKNIPLKEAFYSLLSTKDISLDLKKDSNDLFYNQFLIKIPVVNADGTIRKYDVDIDISNINRKLIFQAKDQNKRKVSYNLWIENNRVCVQLLINNSPHFTDRGNAFGYLNYYDIVQSIASGQHFVSLSKLQIKTKMSSPMEMEFKRSQELRGFQNSLVKEINKLEDFSLLNKFLAFYVSKKGNLVEADQALLISEFSSEMSLIWGSIVQKLESKDEGVAILKESFLTALFYSFVNSLNGYRSTLEIMERLAKASPFLTEMKSKRLVLFIGDTGAGKSASITYFLDITIERDSRNRLNVKDQTKIPDKDFPAIGNFRAVSMTTLVKCFPSVDNAFYLVDTPGFNDTRGMEFDLTAAISKSRAISESGSVLGIVLVIQFGSFTAGRGKEIYDTFDKLSEMFGEGLDSIENAYENCLKIVVSYCPDARASQTLKQLISENYESTKATLNNGDPKYKKRHQVWRIIKTIFDSQGIQCLLVDNAEGTSWLNEQFENVDGIDKSSFTLPFEKAAFYLDFGNSISGSLHIWTDLLFERFKALATSRHKAEMVWKAKETEMTITKAKIATLEKEIKTLKSQHDATSSRLETSRFSYRFSSKTKQDNSDVASYRSKIKEHEQTIQALQMGVEKANEEIKYLQQQIKVWSGDTEEHITLSEFRLVDSKYEILSCFFVQDESTFKINIFKGQETRFQNLLGPDIQFTPNYSGPISDFSGEITYAVPIDKSYRFDLANENQEPRYDNIRGVDDEFIAQGDGVFSMGFCSVNNSAFLSDSVGPVVSKNGRKIVYFVRLIFSNQNTSWSSPTYQIFHKIHKSEMYQQDIRNSESKILNLSQRILESKKEKESRERDIRDLQDKIGQIEEVEKQMKDLKSFAQQVTQKESERSSNIKSLSEIEKEERLLLLEYYDTVLHVCRLALVIVENLSMAKSCRELCLLAAGNNEISKALKYPSNASDLLKKCTEFIKYYDENANTIFNESKNLLHQFDLMEIMNTIEVAKELSEKNNSVEKGVSQSQSDGDININRNKTTDVRNESFKRSIEIGLNYNWFRLEMAFCVSPDVMKRNLDKNSFVPKVNTDRQSLMHRQTSNLQFEEDSYLPVFDILGRFCKCPSEDIIQKLSSVIAHHASPAISNPFLEHQISFLFDVVFGGYDVRYFIFQCVSELFGVSFYLLHHEANDDKQSKPGPLILKQFKPKSEVPTSEVLAFYSDATFTTIQMSYYLINCSVQSKTNNSPVTPNKNKHQHSNNSNSNIINGLKKPDTKEMKELRNFVADACVAALPDYYNNYPKKFGEVKKSEEPSVFKPVESTAEKKTVEHKEKEKEKEKPKTEENPSPGRDKSTCVTF